MPGDKLPRCPKGEKRDKKTKLCVKKTRKASPKKSTPKNLTPKKKVSPKKSSPSRSSSVSKNSKSNSSNSNKKNVVPLLSKMKDLTDNGKMYLKYVLLSLQDTTSYDHIETIIKKEIHAMETSGKSGDYTFSIKNVKLIIPHLKDFLVYFKHISKGGYVRTDSIFELME